MTSVAGLYTQVGMNEIMINFVEEREFSLIFVCISNGILFFYLVNQSSTAKPAMCGPFLQVLYLSNQDFNILVHCIDGQD